MVMGKVQVGASSGEVGYQASTIAKIDFPEPPQLKTTAAFLSQGQPEKALADIEPVVKYYEPFRDIPGNWWAQAALLKVSALSGMQLDKEAENAGRRNSKKRRPTRRPPGRRNCSSSPAWCARTSTTRHCSSATP